MTYTWLLFDADGTLFDYEAAEAAALRLAFAQAGLPYSPGCLTAYQRINQAVWRELELGLITPQALRVARFSRLLDELGATADATTLSTLYLARLSEQAQLIAWAEETVRSLRRTHGLAIITNGLREVQRPRLARAPIGDCFSALVISEEIGVAKPDPAFFDIALERIGRPPRAEVLIIGDSLTSDIAGGNRSGIDTCWYNPGGARNATDARATFEIRMLPELLSISR
jgi:2-haloacid dehalogenase